MQTISRFITIHHDYEPHDAIVAPHWTKGSTELKPVGYVVGNAVQVEATFTFACENIAKYKIYAKGIGSDGFDFPVQVLNISGVTGTYDVQKSTKVFTAKTVDYYDKFAIKWQVSFDDEKTWKDAGTSENPLYVPLSQLNGCNLDDERVFYSVIHYACKPAKGLSSPSDIFNSIWNNFKTLTIPRIDKPSIGAMEYWGEANPLTPGCRGTQGLLNYEAANCGEWSTFMRHCLGMNSLKDGCSGVIEAMNVSSSTIISVQSDFIAKFGASTTVYYARNTFLVKNWNIPILNQFYYVGRKYLSTGGGNQYTNFTGSLICPNGDKIEQGDILGDKAQGITDPETLFGDHAVICYPNGNIYDPSYGTGPFTDIKDWEAQSIDAYAREIVFFDNLTQQPISIVYPHERESSKKQQVIYSCN